MVAANLTIALHVRNSRPKQWAVILALRLLGLTIAGRVWDALRPISLKVGNQEQWHSISWQEVLRSIE